MKSKLLVLAVLSTLSMAAAAETIDLDSVSFDLATLAPSAIDISVVNTAINTGAVDASINILSNNDLSISQSASITGEATVDVTVTASDVSTTTTTTTLNVENIGNKFSTNAIGAIVQDETTINTAMNTTSESTDNVVNAELRFGGRSGLDFDLALDLESNSASAAAPEVFVANSAINTADLNASVEIQSSGISEFGGSVDLQNLSISTNAIGAAVVSKTTINVGGGL